MKRFPWSKVGPYILVQVVGAFLGAATAYLVYYDAISVQHDLEPLKNDTELRAFGHALSTGGIFATYPADHTTVFGCFIDQVGFMGALEPCLLRPTLTRLHRWWRQPLFSYQWWLWSTKTTSKFQCFCSHSSWLSWSPLTLRPSASTVAVRWTRRVISGPESSLGWPAGESQYSSQSFQSTILEQIQELTFVFDLGLSTDTIGGPEESLGR